MANVSFTRDEAILALDVLYFDEDLRLNKESKEIVELSELLNELPIIPLSARGEIFRNSNGIKNQLIKFKSSYAKRKKIHMLVRFSMRLLMNSMEETMSCTKLRAQ